MDQDNCHAALRLAHTFSSDSVPDWLRGIACVHHRRPLPSHLPSPTHRLLSTLSCRNIPNNGIDDKHIFETIGTWWDYAKKHLTMFSLTNFQNLLEAQLELHNRWVQSLPWYCAQHKDTHGQPTGTRPSVIYGEQVQQDTGNDYSAGRSVRFPQHRCYEHGDGGPGQVEDGAEKTADHELRTAPAVGLLKYLVGHPHFQLSVHEPNNGCRSSRPRVFKRKLFRIVAAQTFRFALAYFLTEASLIRSTKHVPLPSIPPSIPGTPAIVPEHTTAVFPRLVLRSAGDGVPKSEAGNTEVQKQDQP
ncbi:hypothetical protein V8D89_011718 [Ganoderma adspersum]